MHKEDSIKGRDNAGGHYKGPGEGLYRRRAL